MFGKKKPETKAKPRRAKGPDNNKRLAQLEQAEARRQGKPEHRGGRHDYPRAYDLGQRAKASNIPLDQAPVFESEAERKAYEEGYNA